MTGLSDPVSVRLLKRDLSAQLDITGHRWELSAIRSAISECWIDVDRTPHLNKFIAWDDIIEFRQAGQVMMRYVLRRDEPSRLNGTTRVFGVGLAAQLRRRNHPAAKTFGSQAMDVWREMLNAANTIEPLLFDNQSDGAELGEIFTHDVEESESMIGLYERLAGSFIVYAEHSGGMEARAIGDEAAGPPIQPHWLAGTSAVPAVESEYLANEFAVRYGGRDLPDIVTYPPGGAADPNRLGGRLQSPPFEFPEVQDAAEAYTIARKIYDRFSTPQVVLPEVDLDTGKVKWSWLVPGRNQRSSLAGSEGIVFNLGSVIVQGAGNAVTAASAQWDTNSADGLVLRSSTGIRRGS